MKTLLITLALTASFSSHARSILFFKTVSKCETIQKVKNKEVLVDIQKAQDGQVQLVITLEGQEAQKIQAKEKLPPKGMAGGSTRYVGKDIGTDNDVVLSITAGTAPVKVGKTIGRRSTLNIENQIKDLALVCASVAK